MNWRSTLTLFIPVVAAVTTAVAPVSAVITLGPTGRNTEAPTGSLSTAGWQYQGDFGPFLGTAISSKYFITAQHVGGGLGANFFYQGQNYVTDQVVDIPGTDLRLFRVGGTLPNWAQLYNPAIDGDEVGKRLVVFGRGTQRGEPVYGPSVGTANVTSAVAPTVPVGGSGGMSTSPSTGPDIVGQPINGTGAEALKGWKWGPADSVRSWGENQVSEVFSEDGLGSLMYFTFDADSGPNEAHLSSGDSGGGVFLQVGNQWKLAGVNFSVDGPFRNTPTDASYLAALFDVGGLYIGDTPQLISERLGDVPSGAYASAVSRNLPFIVSTLSMTATRADVPEPAAAAALGAVVLLTRRARR